jgi:hypothetical protein
MSSSADWYARKLRGEPTVRQEPLPPIPVARPQVPQQVHQQLQQPSRQPLGSVPSQGGGCPNCGSPNYGAPSKNMLPRCFECGEGLAIQNSTQGLSGSTSDGPATPAVQVPTAGYNPQQIVGKVQ